MRTIRTIAEMRAWLGNARAEGRTVGLVPTMGAFHAGHHSLMRAAREEQDSVVVSLFVNPAQFNDTRDLVAYPRTEANDAAEAPSSASTCSSPPGERDLPRRASPRRCRSGGSPRSSRAPSAARALRRRLHGRQQAAQHRRARRRLLRPEGRAAGRGRQADGARPRHAGADRGLPTVREADGLALSSRNVRLSPADRARALGLSAPCERPAMRARRRRARCRPHPRRRARRDWETSRPSTSRSSTRSPSPRCTPSAPHARRGRGPGRTRPPDRQHRPRTRPGGDRLAGVNHQRSRVMSTPPKGATARARNAHKARPRCERSASRS